MTYALPPLNAVRAFEAAARHLSFKLAAHELHVTPAAVGQQVKALEARLGVQLFERLHKQLILTEVQAMEKLKHVNIIEQKEVGIDVYRKKSGK